MKKYFLVGIGGAGMQALAQILRAEGDEVSGSDMTDFSNREMLESTGIKVFIGHQADNLADDTDTLIYSSAVSEDNPERTKAGQKGIEQVKRSTMIGRLLATKHGIGVAGTHGKTTTSTMLYEIFAKAGRDPMALIGAEVKSIQGSGKFGRGEVMIVEACEYDRSFLDMHPKSTIITNIEADHLDYYKDINEIKSAFTTYAEGLSPDGFLVGCGDSDNVREVVKNTPAQLIFYGTNEDNDWRLVSHQVKDEKSVWQISGPEGERELTIGLPGVDLALDVLASVIMARQFDIEWSVIEEVVANFQGAKRRFEKKWVSDDVVVIDDYAHHPTEIASLIRAIKELYPDRNLYAVFQPHQLSRTKLLYDDFVKVLSGIDNLAILPVFVVRDIGGSTEAVDLSRKLAEAIGAKFINDFAEAQGWLKQGSKPMIWLTLGAGRTNYLADELVDKLSGES